jgi:flagellar basal-body rod protein FlgC
MTMFAAIGISGSGIDAAQTWIDTNAGNLANMNDLVATARPAYAQETPVFVPVSGIQGQGQGVRVSGVALGSTVADANGNVRAPDIQVGDQLVGMIEAQNQYQANVAAMERATTAYRSALTLGS